MHVELTVDGPVLLSRSEPLQDGSDCLREGRFSPLSFLLKRFTCSLSFFFVPNSSQLQLLLSTVLHAHHFPSILSTFSVRFVVVTLDTFGRFQKAPPGVVRRFIRTAVFLVSAFESRGTPHQATGSQTNPQWVPRAC